KAKAVGATRQMIVGADGKKPGFVVLHQVAFSGDLTNAAHVIGGPAVGGHDNVAADLVEVVGGQVVYRAIKANKVSVDVVGRVGVATLADDPENVAVAGVLQMPDDTKNIHVPAGALLEIGDDPMDGQ